MTAASQTDASVQYLEDKLSLLTRRQSEASRNAALDILTGRVRAQAVDAEFEFSAPAMYAAPVDSRRAPSRKLMWPRVAIAVALSAGMLAIGLWRHAQTTVELAPVAAIVPALEPEAVPQPAPTVMAEPQPEPPTVRAQEPAPAVALPPVAAAVPTVVPQPAMTLQVLLDERFTSNQRGWLDNPSGTAWLSPGAYQLAAKTTSRFVAVGIPGAVDLRDAVLTASFKKTGGPAGGGYGLIVRSRDGASLDGSSQVGHYYVFEVGDRGEVGVWLRDADRWVDLLTWSKSDAVKPGAATNELTVSAIGDHLSFLVNGIPVASQVDDMLHAGAAGIFVGGDGNQVALEHLTIRVPS